MNRRELLGLVAIVPAAYVAGKVKPNLAEIKAKKEEAYQDYIEAVGTMHNKDEMHL